VHFIPTWTQVSGVAVREGQLQLCGGDGKGGVDFTAELNTGFL
jgi:hypothetical protein